MKTGSLRLMKRSRQVKGLSYVEVMVSTITSAVFLSTTLQAYVAATGIRAKSQQIKTAIATMQDDTESIRQLARNVPQTAADCQLSSSNSYAQHIVATIADKETVAYNLLSPQPPFPPPITVVLEPSKGQSVLQQSTTLPMSGLPDDYRLRRILLVDQSVPPSAQVLQISYQVLRFSTAAQPEGNTDSPQILQIQSEAPLAQLHTSIIPNAALVCF
jgi:Tfp pilus assembly protein PilE